MNKYKLVPYLVLSKEDAQLEKMHEELSIILNDKSIDDATKLALYEDLLSKINRFRESMSKDTVVRLQMPTAPKPESTALQTEPEPEEDRDDFGDDLNSENSGEYQDASSGASSRSERTGSRGRKSTSTQTTPKLSPPKTRSGLKYNNRPLGKTVQYKNPNRWV